MIAEPIPTFVTLLGSLLMLVALVYLYHAAGGSFDLAAWHDVQIALPAQVLLCSFVLMRCYPMPRRWTSCRGRCRARARSAPQAA
jgi:hypothetical protein